MARQINPPPLHRASPSPRRPRRVQSRPGGAAADSAPSIPFSFSARQGSLVTGAAAATNQTLASLERRNADSSNSCDDDSKAARGRLGDDGEHCNGKNTRKQQAEAGMTVSRAAQGGKSEKGGRKQSRRSSSLVAYLLCRCTRELRGTTRLGRGRAARRRHGRKQVKNTLKSLVGRDECRGSTGSARPTPCVARTLGGRGA